MNKKNWVAWGLFSLLAIMTTTAGTFDNVNTDRRGTTYWERTAARAEKLDNTFVTHDVDDNVLKVYVDLAAGIQGAQDAIDSCGDAGGGEVTLGEGDWPVAADGEELYMRTGVHLKGLGRDRTSIYFTDTYPTAFRGVINVSGDSNVVISDMALSGGYNSTADSLGAWTSTIGVYFFTEKTKNTEIRDCYFHENHYGIRSHTGHLHEDIWIHDNEFFPQYVHDDEVQYAIQSSNTPALADNWRIEKNEIHNDWLGWEGGSNLGGISAIYFSGGNSSITDNYLHDWATRGGPLGANPPGGIGIHVLEGAENVVVDGNILERVAGDNISARGNNGTVTNNIMRNSNDQGVAIENAFRTIVTGNIVDSCRTVGIRALNSSETIISFNYIKNPAADGEAGLDVIGANAKSGIALYNNGTSDNMVNTTISNNRVLDEDGNAVYGILIDENVSAWSDNVDSVAVIDNMISGVDTLYGGDMYPAALVHPSNGPKMFNILDFGSGLDDAIDDADMLQRTINAAEANGWAAAGADGGIVYIPAGRTIVTAQPCTLKSNVQIIGEGQAVSQILNQSDSPTFITPSGSSVENWAIRNITIRGNRPGDGSKPNQHGIALIQNDPYVCSNFVIENVDLWNLGGNGLHFWADPGASSYVSATNGGIIKNIKTRGTGNNLGGLGLRMLGDHIQHSFYDCWFSVPDSQTVWNKPTVVNPTTGDTWTYHPAVALIDTTLNDGTPCTRGAPTNIHFYDCAFQGGFSNLTDHHSVMGVFMSKPRSSISFTGSWFEGQADEFFWPAWVDTSTAACIGTGNSLSFVGNTFLHADTTTIVAIEEGIEEFHFEGNSIRASDGYARLTAPNATHYSEHKSEIVSFVFSPVDTTGAASPEIYYAGRWDHLEGLGCWDMSIPTHEGGTSSDGNEYQMWLLTATATTDEVVIFVDGTTIDSSGTQVTSQTENIIIPHPTPAGTLFRTDNWWTGRADFNHTSGTRIDANWGRVSGWSNFGKDFIIKNMEVHWFSEDDAAGAPDIELIYYHDGLSITEDCVSDPVLPSASILASRAMDHASGNRNNTLEDTSYIWRHYGIDTLIEAADGGFVFFRITPDPDAVSEYPMTSMTIQLEIQRIE